MQKWVYSVLAVPVIGALVFGPSSAGAGPSKPSQPEIVGHTTAAQSSKMEAQGRARSAADEIRRATERARPEGFTGIELYQGSVRLWYKGTPPTAISSAVSRARGSAPVELMPAKYSLAELEAASERLVRYMRAHPGGPAHLVSIPVDGSGLIVGVDPAAAASAGLGLPEVGVPVRTVGQARIEQFGRYNDVAPFYGGGGMQSTDGGGCGNGFGVRIGSQEYLLTAAHCGFPGQGWKTGDGLRWIGYVTHEDVGSDLMLIATHAGAYIFTDVGGSGSVGHVIGWGWVYTGEELCTSGPVTTWLCGHVVKDAGNTTQCNYDHWGNWECVTGLVWSVHEDGIAAGRPGDSGGPVVLPTAYGLIAKGTIYGGRGSNLFWQDFATVWQIWGAQPIT